MASEKSSDEVEKEVENEDGGLFKMLSASTVASSIANAAPVNATLVL